MYASTRFWKSTRTSASGLALVSAAFCRVASEICGFGGFGAAFLFCALAGATPSAQTNASTPDKRMTFMVSLPATECHVHVTCPFRGQVAEGRRWQGQV